MKSFRDWMAQQPTPDSPFGDFISEARADDKFPDRLEEWYEVKDYLRTRNACDAAINAGREVWITYWRYRSGHLTPTTTFGRASYIP